MTFGCFIVFHSCLIMLNYVVRYGRTINFND